MVRPAFRVQSVTWRVNESWNLARLVSLSTESI